VFVKGKIHLFFIFFLAPFNPLKTGYLPCRPLALKRLEAANLSAFLPRFAVMLFAAGLGLACACRPALFAEGGGGFADVGFHRKNAGASDPRPGAFCFSC
jgi:hypothetical protein